LSRQTKRPIKKTNDMSFMSRVKPNVKAFMKKWTKYEKELSLAPHCRNVKVGKRAVFNISRWQGVGASPCFWANDTAQIFWRKSPFFLKSIRQTVPLFKERFATSMPAGYTFNAPQEKYRQLGELWLNQCGDTRQYRDTFKMKRNY